jgi:preprotein translocase subunit SecE
VSKELTQQSKPNAFKRLIDRLTEYLKDTRGELRKTSWPTREQATNLTLIVLAVTVVMAAFLGALDFVFAQLIRFIVSL